jgi:hypothetical protein
MEFKECVNKLEEKFENITDKNHFLVEKNLLLKEKIHSIV